MMIIGCDYHPSWQQICWLDTLTGETEEKKLDHASGEAEKFYRQLGWAGVDWDGVDRELPVVCGDGHDGGARGVDRRCGEDSRQRSAAAEDGPARCGAAFETAAGRTVSADLDAVG